MIIGFRAGQLPTNGSGAVLKITRRSRQLRTSAVLALRPLLKAKYADAPRRGRDLETMAGMPSAISTAAKCWMKWPSTLPTQLQGTFQEGQRLRYALDGASAKGWMGQLVVTGCGGGFLLPRFKMSLTTWRKTRLIYVADAREARASLAIRKRTRPETDPSGSPVFWNHFRYCSPRSLREVNERTMHRDVSPRGWSVAWPWVFDIH